MYRIGNQGVKYKAANVDAVALIIETKIMSIGIAGRSKVALRMASGLIWW